MICVGDEVWLAAHSAWRRARVARINANSIELLYYTGTLARRLRSRRILQRDAPTFRDWEPVGTQPQCPSWSEGPVWPVSALPAPPLR